MPAPQAGARGRSLAQHRRRRPRDHLGIGTKRSEARIAADLVGQDGLDAHGLRPADQVACAPSSTGSGSGAGDRDQSGHAVASVRLAGAVGLARYLR